MAQNNTKTDNMRIQEQEDHWMNREELFDEDSRNKWLEEGIDLYKNLRNRHRNEPRYSVMLANYSPIGERRKNTSS